MWCVGLELGYVFLFMQIVSAQYTICHMRKLLAVRYM